MNLQCFEPEILYAFDLWNQPDNENMIHHHDFFEISIILQGESLYLIDNEWRTVRSGDILLFNPGVDHINYISAFAILNYTVWHKTISQQPNRYFPCKTVS